MIDLFKLSVKSILFCAGFLGCAHAELTIDDIVDLLNLRNPKEVSNGGVEVLPGGPPPPPGMGMPQGASSNSFPKLRQILNKQASITAKSEATSFLNKIDKMYDFRGTIPLNGRNIPYKSSKDIEYIRTTLNIQPPKSEGDLALLENLIAQVKSVKIDFDNIKVDGNTLSDAKRRRPRVSPVDELSLSRILLPI